MIDAHQSITTEPSGRSPAVSFRYVELSPPDNHAAHSIVVSCGFILVVCSCGLLFALSALTMRNMEVMPREAMILATGHVIMQDLAHVLKSHLRLR